MTLSQSNDELPFRDASGFCNVLMSAIGGDTFAHLITEKFEDLLKEIQQETDRRWVRLKELAANPIL